jgi:membrane protease YdiL (CAAX protease family)
MPAAARAFLFLVVAVVLMRIGGIPALTLLVATLLFLRVERVTPAVLGLRPNGRRFAELFGGFLLGAVLVASWFFALRLKPTPHPNAAWSDLARASLFYLGSAASEELAFRGYSFARLRDAWGVAAAQAIAAAAFAGYHITLGFPLIPALVFTGFGSLFYGFAFVRSGGVMLPVGLHWGWNLAQEQLGGMSGRGRGGLFTLSGPQSSFIVSCATLIAVQLVGAAIVALATRRRTPSTIRVP